MKELACTIRIDAPDVTKLERFTVVKDVEGRYLFKGDIEERADFLRFYFLGIMRRTDA